MNKFQSVIPVLYVKNLAASVEYYEKKLGFTKNWEWGEPPDFCSIGRDNVEIFLCEGGQGHPGTWLCINIENVDELHDQYKLSGANIQHPPTTYPWNMREMLVQDLDGHCLRIGHGIPEGNEEECPEQESDS